MKLSKVLNLVLHQLFETYKDLVLIGEDICDPYGGAFKITRGMSTKYPDRVISTPVSEAGIVGVATGLAIGGYRPIVEIMFGDFLSLAFDQLLNHATKYPQMFNTKSCPMIIRTPMGGGRGYGPTHSQSLEKYFLGMPGLNLFVVDRFSEINSIFEVALNSDFPSLIIENKILYNYDYYPLHEEIFVPQYSCFGKEIEGGFKCFTFNKEMDFDVVILTYGRSIEIALEAGCDLLIDHEINCVVYSTNDLLANIPDKVLESVSISTVFATLEEGTGIGSVGEHFLSKICSNSSPNFKYLSFTSEPTIIPAAKELEDNVLPSSKKICNDILTVLGVH